MSCRGDMRKSISLKPESQQCTHCKYANCGGKKVNADIQNAFENSKLTAFHWKVYFMQFIHDNKKKISNDFIYSVYVHVRPWWNIFSQEGRKGGISNITLQLVIILNMDNI